MHGPRLFPLLLSGWARAPLSACFLHTAQDTIDDAVDRGKTVMRRVRKNVGDAKDFVNEVADTAQGAFREARSASS
jgi:hypothetical protein